MRLGLYIGSTIGSMIPMLWGDDFLSFSSVILTAVGASIGVYIGWHMGE